MANSIKSHNHTQPTHTHSFSGQLVSTALTGTATGQKYSSSVNLTVSGTAAGQRYSDSGILWTTNYYDATGVTNGSGPIRSSHISSNTTTKTASSSSISGTAKGTVSGTAQASSVSGNLLSRTVSGTIGAGGGDPTDYMEGPKRLQIIFTSAVSSEPAINIKTTQERTLFFALSLYFNWLFSYHQSTRNWSGLSGGTSRIIRECSSGDTEDRQAITMAR